ncbi:hypothetical protein [Dokdonella sp.]|uniref:hypothetical protein n=1 Tax=Dokdonella sp. TaxID=2291710 RepID=UPI002D7EAB65|nr:hypothetical protein [Dokdonella sp.]
MTEAPNSGPGLLARILNLCRFRGGPQDLPHKQGLLVALLVMSVVLDLSTASLFDIGSSALGRSLFSTSLLLGLCWTALVIRGLRNRFVQTAIALIACSMVFSMLILPLAWLFGTPAESDKLLSPVQTLVAWLALGVLVWKVAVDAHNVRQAIDAPFWIGMSLALAWAIADFALSRLLFSGPV